MEKTSELLCEMLVFHFKGFEVTKHLKLHVASTIEGMWQMGKLTRAPARARNWVGVFWVRKLANALLVDALVDGTSSWDVTIHRILSIVLQAALPCRSGDIYPTHHATSSFLCWNDVQIKFRGNSTEGVENLIAQITIRDHEGWK
jgi:hypothetical protein